MKSLLDDGVDGALETLSGGKRYYIKRVGQNQWTVIVLHEVTETVAEAMKSGRGNSFTDWFVKTFLTDTDGGRSFFNSEEEARKSINEDVDEIDC